MKIALVGGHLAPALAVLEVIGKKADPIFIGRKVGFEGDTAITLEYRTITSLNVPFYSLTAGRLQRNVSLHTIPSLLKFPLGIKEAVAILKNTKPDVVVSFGGYLSLPVAYAAHFLDIPLVIHEQTLEAGFANKVISPFASIICISWESSRRDFAGKRIEVTGNPVRREIFAPRTPNFAEIFQSTLPKIYITGGSAGSHAINELVRGCVGELLEHAIVIHQTGDARVFRDFERLSALRDSLDPRRAKRYLLRKFVDPSEVGYVYRHADVVVSRSGINTVTELLMLDTPALFIPLPFSQRQEQYKNAQFLKKQGLAEVLLQDVATSGRFYEKITSMLRHKKMYTIKHGEKKYRHIIEEAADRIASCAFEAAKEKNKS